MELRGMDLVFHHATGLESLSLRGLDSSIFPILGKYSSALPHLTSFRFSVVRCNITAENWRDLCEFLQKRVLLRRLLLYLPAEWAIVSTIFPVIEKMPELSVLGLDTGFSGQELSREEFACLATILSPKLTAMAITICWTNPWADIAILSPLWERLQQLPSLVFLNIDSGFDTLPVLAEELASELKHLEIVGLNGCLWDIDRTQDSEECSVSKWPALKVKYCVVNDFGSEDKAWIFRC